MTRYKEEAKRVRMCFCLVYKRGQLEARKWCFGCVQLLFRKGVIRGFLFGFEGVVASGVRLGIGL